MLQVASTTNGPATLARGALSGDGWHGCPEKIGMGWDGMEWDGMEWDGMEWDGIKFEDEMR